MRLNELEPRWVGLPSSFDKTVKVGLTFNCPHCLKQRLAIEFDPPIDPENKLLGTNWAAALAGRQVWRREGDTFDTMSLSPSVNAELAGHWHGFIKNGEIA